MLVKQWSRGSSPGLYSGADRDWFFFFWGGGDRLLLFLMRCMGDPMIQFSPIFTSNCGIDHLTPALHLDKGCSSSLSQDKFLLGTRKNPSTLCAQPGMQQILECGQCSFLTR